MRTGARSVLLIILSQTASSSNGTWKLFHKIYIEREKNCPLSEEFRVQGDKEILNLLLENLTWKGINVILNPFVLYWDAELNVRDRNIYFSCLFCFAFLFNLYYIFPITS